MAQGAGRRRAVRLSRMQWRCSSPTTVPGRNGLTTTCLGPSPTSTKGLPRLREATSFLLRKFTQRFERSSPQGDRDFSDLVRSLLNGSSKKSLPRRKPCKSDRRGTTNGQSLLPGLHSSPVRSHLIFYRVEDETVSIVRILHGSRNITPKMFPQSEGET